MWVLSKARTLNLIINQTKSLYFPLSFYKSSYVFIGVWLACAESGYIPSKVCPGKGIRTSLKWRANRFREFIVHYLGGCWAPDEDPLFCFRFVFQFIFKFLEENSRTVFLVRFTSLFGWYRLFVIFRVSPGCINYAFFRSINGILPYGTYPYRNTA